ncbi:MAG: MerR family transcriptional regulator [Clostridiales bacterium]|nr:MerR family transcriptional regulator [Clostridiales bacterium]
MTMHEVCARLGLTKKAVRYYVGEGLVAPRRLENGYADFSEADCETLERVALLRRLDLPLCEIRVLLAGGSAEAALNRLGKQIAREQAALRLLSGFSETRDYASLKRALTAEEQKRTIAERLESAFPGGFGRVVALMFAPYLTQPAETADQQSALGEIIAFLDNVPAMDPVLIDEMQRTFAPIDAETAEKMRRAKESAAADPQNWLEENEELVRQYAAFKQSAAYRASPAGKIEDYLRAFCQESGYNDVFIPALRRLSPAYDAYQRRLIAANDAFSRALQSTD